MNSSGIAMAGGVGKFMAQWILEGEPEMNLWSVDARRFVDMHNNKLFLKDRVTETIGEYGGCRFETRELQGKPST